jgi:hypothetical protein
MKKIISNKTYDTENSTLIQKKTFGNFGDPIGFEESLYQTPQGFYFLYTNGGEQSKYKTENITRLSAAKKDSWLNT